MKILRGETLLVVNPDSTHQLETGDVVKLAGTVNAVCARPSLFNRFSVLTMYIQRHLGSSDLLSCNPRSPHLGPGCLRFHGAQTGH